MYSASDISGAAEGSLVDLATCPSKQSEFSSFWSSSSLGKAVLQGKKLRNEKPKYLPQHQYDVINIDYIKRPQNYQRRSNISKRRSRKLSVPSNILLRSGSTILPYNRNNKHCCLSKRARKKKKFRRRCPMRIVELAVPSKRHCLETWRSKSSILPDYMVERLKQQVLDQRPIVKISDAIYCFKRRRHLSPKRTCKKRKNVECIWNYCQADTKAMCAIFGHKIALYLNKPMAVSLSPRLKRISNIVSDEIFSLLRKKMSFNKTVNQKILYETAAKVTIWMEMLLEQSTYKLQEDELNDLEGEIGPVLDLIDDLIENILDICAPDRLECDISIDEESKESSLSGDFEERAAPEISFSEEALGVEEFQAIGEDYETIETEPEHPTEDVETLQSEDLTSILNFFKNEIEDIILNINKEFEVNLEEENVITDKTENVSLDIQKQGSDTDNFLDRLELQTDIGNTLPNFEDVKDITDEIDIDHTASEDIDLNESHIEVPENDIEEQTQNKDDTANLNVSEKSQILSEEADDDNNKKVKFSDNDMGTRRQLEIHSDTHLIDNHLDTEKEQVSWNASADNLKSSIIFAPPNENLLSDADESWPENIPSPVLRPSESISRSVTSLGRILETDEKLPVSSESDDAPKKYKEEIDQQIKETIESLKNNGLKPIYDNKVTKDKVIKKKIIESKGKSSDASRPQKPNISREYKKSTGARKSSPPKTVTKIEKNKDHENVKHKQKTEKYPASHSGIRKKGKQDFNTADKKDFNIDIAQDKLNKSVAKEPSISAHKDSQNERSKRSKESSRKQDIKAKRDYKVDEATAPNWLKRKRADMQKDQTFGVHQYEIRKWCSDLQHEFDKFETWNDWLKCMCRNFVNLYQTQAAGTRITRCDLKRWIKFKRNFDKNALTWAKLHRRTLQRLNQTIYICVKTSETASPKRYPSRCASRNLKKSPSSPHCSTYRTYF